ncbi:hypothetical protein L8106_18537 [Lyngbya sp. PCC 8106]|nr:hypothetical protein L8106_18537 [Lyngbya sp. PCC 8106]
MVYTISKFMGSLIFSNHKSTNLIDLLLQGNFHENRPLTLTLVSCYFSSEAANEIIIRLVKKLKGEGLQLEKIQFYIDRGIALEIGKKKLLDFFEQLKSKYPNLRVEFNLINQESMFHCKAYCLSHNNEKGSLVVGYANLTKAALTDPQGNIELLLATQETKSIVCFFEDLKTLDHIPLSEIEKFDQDDYYWKFALLKEGKFVKDVDLK